MTTAQVIVTAGGLMLAAAIVWFFWGPRRAGVAAALTADGQQEAMILVKGGYTPDIVIVRAGQPVRLTFRREENVACSEMVLLPDFGRSAHLPEGETVDVEFTPDTPGEYEFSCQMGMFRGRLVVQA